MIIFSVDGHHLANITIMSFAIRNKAALRMLMQIYGKYMATYMAIHFFFLMLMQIYGNLHGATYFFPRSLRSLATFNIFGTVFD